MATEIDVGKLTGLSQIEVEARLKRDGFNELASAKPRSAFAIAIEVVREPMFLLLVACGAVYFSMGDAQEAIMLLGFVLVIIGITFYQERKTERALEALRDLSSPRALVIRDGLERRIAGREVVVGDMLILTEGDRVPADAVLLSSNYLSVDESLLTGESVAVHKLPHDDADAQLPSAADGPDALYSGTLVVQGKGIARVHSIGGQTALGRIGKALQTVQQEETRLHKETRRLVRILATVGLGLFVVVVAAYGITHGGTLHAWKNGLLAGLTMAMAILPEEFPVVLTVFLALGAWRIAQKQVLTRRVPALETLGSATLLCVDKTGTLTQNRMSVERIHAKGKTFIVDLNAKRPFPETYHEVLEFSILASQVDPFDPMEKAFRTLGDHFLANTEHLHTNWKLVREYPLSRELLAMSLVWSTPERTDYVIAAKGAPEAVADLCHLDASAIAEMEIQVAEMAKDGLRVLAMAKANLTNSAAPAGGATGSDVTPMPVGQHDFDFEFLGLIGLADPVRPAVPQAIQECYAAGIRVAMITGDYAETARNIARQIGLKDAEEVITGAELDAMSDATLQERIESVNIFARVVPEQKLRLVDAFKANGEIVAMTGDGVNDAPALKSAHIGIAMGGRGTDVARESSDLVLLDDDFLSIVSAIRLGRRIFDNLTKAMAYIFAVHVPIAGMSLLPVLFEWPLMLLPLHIVFLELIIDPACSVVFEAEGEESNVMHRPPRKASEPLFHARMIGISLAQGMMVLAIMVALVLTARARGLSEGDTRAVTYATLIIANLCLILTNRSWSDTILKTMRKHNAALWWVLGGASIFLGLALYLPFLRDLFRFGTVHPLDLAIALGAGVASILWFEGLKLAGFKLGR